MPSPTQCHPSTLQPPPRQQPSPVPPQSASLVTGGETISTSPGAGDSTNWAADSPSIASIEAQIVSLLAAKSRLLASRSAPPALPTLFVMEEIVDAANTAAIAAMSTTKDNKKPILPDVVPGFKSNALDLHELHLHLFPPPPFLVIGLTAILPKAEEAFRTFCYVPYSALTTAARVKADRGDEEFTISTTGAITARGLDRQLEKAISMVDWLATSKAVVERTHFHWGATRADALSSHSSLLMELARLHSWDVAMEYDIQQREAVARNPTYDLAMLDTTALTLIATRIALKLTATLLLSYPLAMPSPTLKHPAAVDPTQPPVRKQTRPEHTICFRCGLAGHLPADCKAKRMMAGKPVAAIVSSSRGEHSLVAPSSKQFCFSWACASSCKFASICYNVHACSLCGDSAHSAASCKSLHYPRKVVTPHIPDRAEELLGKYGILDNWRHIIEGLQFSFNVRITNPPQYTILFRQSHFL
ncbi:hypothetical protein K439DRAFT_1621790 [Ramaria rubella]|nr:hypothetical protein K439DRAFT_1621790 [Ramaria rubella]